MAAIGWRLHRHHRGPQFLIDTTNTGWILLLGQKRIPPLGHQWVLFHGPGHTKQVADRGVDGIIRYYRGKREKPGRIAVSVKGGKQLNPQMVRDLVGVIGSDDTIDGGILVTRYAPTSGMKKAAAEAGSYLGPAGNPNPKVQILTVEQLLGGEKPQVPLIIPPYTEARPVEEVVEQLDLGF